MIYIIEGLDRDREFADEFYKKCLPFLSQQRRDKVFAYRHAFDRSLSAAVYMLLCFGLAERFGITQPVDFAFTPNGKPYLSGRRGIHFSLSHCRAAVACAVSDHPVGVDAEAIAPVTDGMARLVLTENELRVFNESQGRDRVFCEYWVIKESYLKRKGIGLMGELSQLEAGSLNAALVYRGANYCCGASGPVGELRRMELQEACDVLF
jgi:4'-phosphopantetheinyl transferase